jgi:nucleolar complex protein 2
MANTLSFMSIYKLTFSTDEGEHHLLELSKLAEKDPEFYKYLQENDRELLKFDPDPLQTDDSDEDVEHADEAAMEEDGKLPVLTKHILAQWQKGLLKVAYLCNTFDDH